MADDLFRQYRDSGFLNSEARRLADIPNAENIPWLQRLVADRKRKWFAAARRGYSRATFDDDLVEAYKSKGWLRPGYIAEATALDVNAMIRQYCDKFHKGNPDYTSPWQNKPRDMRREHRAVRQSFKDADARVAARLEGAYL